MKISLALKILEQELAIRKDDPSWFDDELTKALEVIIDYAKRGQRRDDRR